MTQSKHLFCYSSGFYFLLWFHCAVLAIWVWMVFYWSSARSDCHLFWFIPFLDSLDTVWPLQVIFRMAAWISLQWSTDRRNLLYNCTFNPIEHKALYRRSWFMVAQFVITKKWGWVSLESGSLKGVSLWHLREFLHATVTSGLCMWGKLIKLKNNFILHWRWFKKKISVL